MVSEDVVYFPKRLILELLSLFVLLKGQVFIIIVLEPINECLQDFEILEEDLEEVDAVELAEKTSIIDSVDRFLVFELLLKAYQFHQVCLAILSVHTKEGVSACIIFNIFLFTPHPFLILIVVFF